MRLVSLSLHLLHFVKHGIRLTKIYADVAADVTLYDTGNNLMLLRMELIEYCLALLLADLLQDYILGILRSDTTELLRLDLLTNRISDSVAA